MEGGEREGWWITVLICAINNNGAHIETALATIRFLRFQKTVGSNNVFPLIAIFLCFFREKPAHKEDPRLRSAVSHVLFAKLVHECRFAAPIPAAFHFDAKTQSRIRGS